MGSYYPFSSGIVMCSARTKFGFLVILWFCLICYNQALGQTPKGLYPEFCINETDGLRGAAPQSVFQDNKGRYWIGSQKGLNFYNGESVEFFGLSNWGFQDDQHFQATMDNQGMIWLLSTKLEEQGQVLGFGANSSLLLFDPITRVTHQFDDYFPDAPFEVKDIFTLQEKQSRIIVSTRQGEIFVFEKSFKKLYQLAPGKAYFEIGFYSNGNSLLHDGLQLVRLTARADIIEKEPLSGYVNDILEWDESQMLVIGAKQMNKDVRLSTQTYLKKRNRPIRKVSADFVKNQSRNIFIGKLNGGNHLVWTNEGLQEIAINDDRLEVLSLLIPRSEIQPKPRFLRVGKDNNIWIFLGAKVCVTRIKEKILQPYPADFASVRDILQQNDSTLFLTTYSGVRTFNLFNGQYSSLDGLKFIQGYCLTEDRDKNLWIGSHHRLVFQVDKDLNRITRHELPKPVTNKNWFGIIPYLTQKGQFLVAPNQGLHYAKSTDYPVERLKFPDSLSYLNRAVFRFLSEDENGVWLASSKGIFRFDCLTETINYQLPVLQNQKVNHFYRKDEKEWWIVTEGNHLYQYNAASKQLDSISIFPASSGNKLHAVIPDHKQNLWLPSNHGLYRLHLPSQRLQCYFEKDGLSNNECNYQANAILKDGRIVVGGINGLTIIDPDQVPEPLPLREDELFIALLKVYNDKGDLVKTIAGEDLSSTQIHLGSRERTIEIILSNKDILLQERRFAYHIDGGTRTALTSNELRFNYLQQGSHQIRFELFGNQVEQKLDELTISFWVARPWYRHPIALLGMFLVVALLIYGSLRWRISLIRSQNQALEMEVYRRTLEIEKQNEKLSRINASKDRLFAMLGHELKGPIYSFIGISDKLRYLMEKGRWEDVAKISRQVDAQCHHLTDQMNNLLVWGQNLISDSYSQTEELDVPQLIKESISEIQELADKKSITILPYYGVLGQTSFDRHAMRIILRNLLHNAIKYSETGSQVRISYKLSDTAPCIIVEDDGIGISSSNIPKILREDFHYSQVGTLGEKGTGLGLRLCRQLARKNQGDIWIESEIGKGTKVYLQLPKGTNKYLEEAMLN